MPKPAPAAPAATEEATPKGRPNSDRQKTNATVNDMAGPLVTKPANTPEMLKNSRKNKTY